MQLHDNLQAEILACIVRGLYKDTYVLDKVEPGFFSVKSYQWLVKYLKQRDWEPAVWDYLDPVIQEKFVSDPDKVQLYRNQIWNLYAKEITFQKDAEEEFKKFVGTSIFKAGAKNAVEAYERSKRFDYFVNELNEMVSGIRYIIEGQSLKTTDWAEGYLNRMQERIYNRDNPESNPIIKTGIHSLDSQIDIKGAMIVNLLAPMKGYKSIMLNSIGFAALLQGYNVLHAVFENTTELTETRYDSLCNNITYNRLKAAVIGTDEKTEIDQRMEWISSWTSRLKIVKCNSKQTKISDIEDQIDRYKSLEGFIPDVVIVDYANIVKPGEYQRENRDGQEQVFWDMKHLVDTYGVPCVTATQANMEGNKAVRLEKPKDGKSQGRLNSSHQGKSIGISQAVDVTIGINQTPQEKLENLLVLSIIFARDADISQEEIVLDSDIKRMSISRDLHHLWSIAKKVHTV